MLGRGEYRELPQSARVRLRSRGERAIDRERRAANADHVVEFGPVPYSLELRFRRDRIVVQKTDDVPSRRFERDVAAGRKVCIDTLVLT